MLKLEESKTSGTGDDWSGTDRDKNLIVRGDINHGNEPTLGKTIISDMPIAGARARDRAEKIVSGGAERAQIAVLVENLDPAVNRYHDLSRPHAAHAIRRDEAHRVGDLGPQKTRSYRLRNEQGLRFIRCR